MSTGYEKTIVVIVVGSGTELRKVVAVENGLEVDKIIFDKEKTANDVEAIEAVVINVIEVKED